MPETLMERLAHADRQTAESEAGRRVGEFLTSSRWVKEHAHLVNYRADDGHTSGRGLNR